MKNISAHKYNIIKKRIVILLSILACSLTTNATGVKFLDFTDSSMIVKIDIDAINLDKKSVSDREFYEVGVNGLNFTKNIGAPSLPSVEFELITSNPNSLDIAFIKGEFVTIPCKLPIKPYDPLEYSTTIKPNTPTYTTNSDIYNRDKLYPIIFGSVISCRQIGRIPLAKLSLQPVFVNTIPKELRYYKTLTLKITYTPISKDSIYNLRTGIVSVLQTTAVNSNSLFSNVKRNSASNILADGNVDIILITVDKYLSVAKKLAKWERRKGYDIKILTKDKWDMNGAISAITKYYDSTTTKPSFVTIFGENIDIPIGYVKNEHKSDTYYGLYTKVPASIKMSVGRISVWDLNEAKAVVDKIIHYEESPLTDEAFYKEALWAIDKELFSSLLGEQNAIQSLLSNSGFNKTTIEKPAINGEVEEYFNSKVGWLSIYCGHGDINRWINPLLVNNAIMDFTNGNKRPVVFTTTCSAAYVGYGRCPAEAFLVNTKGGGIGYVGYAYSVSASKISNMKESLKTMLDPSTSSAPIHTIGDIIMPMLVGPKALLVGSPTTRIYTKNPKKITSSYIRSFNTRNNFEITNLNIDSDAMSEGCAATLYDAINDIIVGAAPITSSTINIPVKNNITTNQPLILTITAPNYSPLIDTVFIGKTTLLAIDKNNVFYNLKIYKNNLSFKLSNSEIMHVRISLFDIRGRELAVLVNRNMQKGYYQIKLNNGIVNFSNGMYICKFNIGNKNIIKSIMVNK